MAKTRYVCDNCGGEVWDYPCHRDDLKHVYCNRECHKEHRRKLAAIPRETAHCACCQQDKPVGEFVQEKRRLYNGGYSCYCNECRRIKALDYYDRNAEALREKTKQRKIEFGYKPSRRPDNPAHAAVRKALKTGELIKADKCEKCGTTARLHGHHWHGYENPLDIIWLCPLCHVEEHGRGPKARDKNGHQ